MKNPLVLFVLIIAFFPLNAQVVPDKNINSVEPIFFDDFIEEGRYFNPNTMREQSNNPRWRCYFKEYWQYGVTHEGNDPCRERQVYQPDHTIFHPELEGGQVHLVSEYAGHALSRDEYIVPQGFGENETFVPPSNVYYYSGALESLRGFKYGYYEIKCKLPIHKGAFPAIWLYMLTGDNGTYEEVDVLEWVYKQWEPNTLEDPNGRRYLTSIWYNPDNNSYSQARHCAQDDVHLPDDNPGLSSWNVISCEWYPTFIRWYLNGVLTKTYSAQDSIPQNHMKLKLNYAIDDLAIDPVSNSPNWDGSDIFAIDYVKVFGINRDCGAEEVVRSIEDLENFNYALKRTITFAPDEVLVMPDQFQSTFRAVEKIRLTGRVTVPTGSKVSFIMQDCEHYETSRWD